MQLEQLFQHQYPVHPHLQQPSTTLFQGQPHQAMDQQVVQSLHQLVQLLTNDMASATSQPQHQQPYQQPHNSSCQSQQAALQIQPLSNSIAVQQQGLPTTMRGRDNPVPQQRPFNGRSTWNERECLVIFIKILMKLIAETNPSLRNSVKAVISECTAKNRLGYENYMPLSDAVHRELKRSIGESYWVRAKWYLDVYCAQNGIQQCPRILPPAMPPNIATCYAKKPG